MPAASTTNSPQQPAPRGPSLPRALALAHRLARRQETVELQGTVIHRSAARPLAAVLVAAGLACLLGPIAPLPGALLLLAVAASLLVDLDGGQGWARRSLVLKDIGHNVLIWRTPRLPEPEDTAVFEHHPPTPPAAPLSQAPQLLLCVPADDADTHHSRPQRGLLVASMVALAAGAVSLLVPALRVLSAPSYAAGLLLALAAAAWLLHVLRPPTTEPSLALPHTEALTEALRSQPPSTLVVSVAFVEGMFAHGDGIEVLLKNFRTILPPEHTRVLILQPAAGPLAVQPRAGLMGRLEADPLLAATTGEATDPGRSRSAARALRIGWRAATIRGDLSETETLMSLVHTLDQAAKAGQW